MITLKESLLSNTKDKITSTKKTITNLANLPLQKDWTKAHRGYLLRWNIQHIIDEYGNLYPFLKDYTHIRIAWPIGWSQVFFYLVDDNKMVPEVKANCVGVVDYGTKITKMKQEVKKFLETITNDPQKMRRFLSAIENKELIDVFGI